MHICEVEREKVQERDIKEMRSKREEEKKRVCLCVCVCE